jgi:peptidoglycan/LPS O-acetylase OafA/YrhL
VIIVFAPVLNNGFYQVLVGNMNIEFMFGCFVGYVFLQKNYSSGILMFVTVIIMLATLFAVCIIWMGFNRFSIIYTTLMGATSGWIIYHAALLDTTKWSRMLARPLLVLAGDASYSIYLTHTVYMPYLFKGTTGLMNLSALSSPVQLLVILFIIAISIFAGIAIHLLIEKPMLIYLRRKFHLARSGTSFS